MTKGKLNCVVSTFLKETKLCEFYLKYLFLIEINLTPEMPFNLRLGTVWIEDLNDIKNTLLVNDV